MADRVVHSERRQTRAVKAGSLIIGGGFPVSVQTMWKRPLTEVSSTVTEEIEALAAEGCDLLRFAVPGMAQAHLVGSLAQRVSLPVVADIHFNHRLALTCMDYPIAKVRINPGNIGGEDKAAEVLRKAQDRGIAVRVGINGGSLPPALRDEQDTAMAMVRAAEIELETLEKLSFHEVVFSLKASDISATVRANRLFAQRYDYPLHLGLTEAGPLVPGTVKSAIALHQLLSAGVGDTIRVSLSDDPHSEIAAGVAILQAAGVRSGLDIVSCPTCGRAVFDVKKALEIVSQTRHLIPAGTTVAVMGCPVNGPGEARHADIGITGNATTATIFVHGTIVRKVPLAGLRSAFVEEVERL